MNLYESIEEDTKQLAEEEANENTGENTGEENSGEEEDGGQSDEGGTGDDSTKKDKATSDDADGGDGEDSGDDEDKGDDDGDGEKSGNEDEEAAKGDKETPVTNSDFARMRREKKALEKKVAAFESNPAKAEKTPPEQKQTPSTDEEPDRVENPAAWLEWQNNQTAKEVADMKAWQEEQQTIKDNDNLFHRATSEFHNYENEFKATTPDYDDAATFYVKQVAQSVKMLNPSITKEQLGQAVQNHILQKAGEFVGKGLDPAEELYHLAKDGGFVKQEEAKDDGKGADKKNEKKVDLKTINKNRKRSASGLSGRGANGATSYTLEQVANMTNGEIARLDPNIIRELEAQGE